MALISIALQAIVLAAVLASVPAVAQETAGPAEGAAPVQRQSLDEAWWTGPMLAAAAGTLPQGHFLVEPYLYDVRSPHADGFGSLTYINYGLTDRLTVGMIPTFGYNRVGGGADSLHIGVGDVSVQAQWRLTQFDPDGWLPTMSINLQESLPTGKYDRLGDRPADGLGSGSRSTTLGLYMQTYFWMPNGRVLRTRLNFSYAYAQDASVADVSVYGTAQGFRGTAKPGDVQTADLAFEYSLTQNWVLAADLLYRHAQSTRVVGRSSPAAPADDVNVDSGPRTSFAIAPAVEYNWNANIGLLLGMRVIPRTRNDAATVTPALALNMVF
ncbi:MAG: transporter [Rudaea sp.]|uniref:transporter n=1 Tax=unclassified Rudaea TaxID=2627037 RepID=UPI0010F73FA5|nr:MULTISPECIES: transporter [unclassified Rudaea]MBN8886450.1 transporter [Rudaea sp.]MBR0344908.1 transporter [Rudaea sp.]